MEFEHLGYKLEVSDDDARAIATEAQRLNHDGRSMDVYLDAGTGRLTFEMREGNERWQKREPLTLIANYNGPSPFDDIMNSIEFRFKGIAEAELKKDRERLKGLIEELAESGKKEWKFENGVRVTNPEAHIFFCFDKDGRYVGSVDLGDGEDVDYLSFIEDMEKGWDPVTDELECLELGQPPAIAYAWKGEAHTISQEDIAKLSRDTIGLCDGQYIMTYLDLSDGSLTWEEFVGSESSWLEFHDPETILAGSFIGQNAPYTERQVSDAIRDKLERHLAHAGEGFFETESDYLKENGLRLLDPDEAEALATPEGRTEGEEPAAPKRKHR